MKKMVNGLVGHLEELVLLAGAAAVAMAVILITHDNEIAEQADRVIKIRDGKIVSDTKQDTTSLYKSDELESVSLGDENQEETNPENRNQEKTMEDADNA